MMFPIITSYEDMLFYMRRNDLFLPKPGSQEQSASHLGDEAGDTRLFSETFPGNADT